MWESRQADYFGGKIKKYPRTSVPHPLTPLPDRVNNCASLSRVSESFHDFHIARSVDKTTQDKTRQCLFRVLYTNNRPFPNNLKLQNTQLIAPAGNIP